MSLSNQVTIRRGGWARENAISYIYNVSKANLNAGKDRIQCIAATGKKVDTDFLVQTVVDAAAMVTDEFLVMAKDAGGDLVTSFDFEIERFIIDKIRETYPDFQIVSEEFNPTNKLSPNCFVIDPIDGTINFANGLPLWGIQVAMVRDGSPVCSVIFLPRLNELYYADDTGAYLNHRPISVGTQPPDKCLYLVEGGDKFPALQRLNISSRHWRYFCCTALNMAWTACGRLGGAILRKDNVWDYLPGQYLVQMAGGHVINKKGAHIAANTKELAKRLLRDGRL